MPQSRPAASFRVPPMKPNRLSLTAFLILTACASPTAGNSKVVAPMPMQGNAFDAAGEIKLPKVEAQQYEGLHNVSRSASTS